MEQAVNTIIELLSKIRDAYAGMLAVSAKKQTCIIKADAQGLNQAVSEEWELIRWVSELEEKRLEAAAGLQSAWGTGVLTLAEMQKRVEPYEREKLKRISEDLKKTIAAQKKVNDQNRELLRLHFDYMNFMMSNLLQDQSDIYGHSGSIMQSSPDAGIFDSRV